MITNFKFVLSFVILLWVCQLPGYAQMPAATPPPDDKDVVKISTNLIQIDVTVTDKKGNLVKDLKPGDFEVYENGARQNISDFLFVNSGTANQPAETKKQNSATISKNTVPAPSFKLRPEQVRRTYAIVIDDLGLSFSSISWVKDSLKRFVKEQMQDGDLVAILRVGGGLGALQSFTSDKQQLLAAIGKIRWNSENRVGVNSYAAIKPSFLEEIANLKGESTASPDIERDNAATQERESKRQSNIAVGTFGALRAVIRGMSELPGRKSIMLFSEGFQILDRRNRLPQATGILDEMRAVSDLATRASIVFYTFDPRGIDVPMKEAQDQTNGDDDRPFQRRQEALRESKDSLRYLADETGGLAYVDLNNISTGIQTALDDQQGYYLLGYQPDEDTFDPKKSKFNKLEIKTTRPDLKIRYRSGFFGITDEKKKQTEETASQKLNSALLSPFGASEINLDLYSIFFNDSQNKNYINSFVRIDPKDLKFIADANGRQKAMIDIVAITFGDNGLPIDQTIKRFALEFSEEEYRKILEKGFIYKLTAPIKNPGAYQFRIALRDEGSGKIGSASQFIEVPNIGKKQLTLSNLIVKNYSLASWRKISASQNNDADLQYSDVFSDTTARQFKGGSILNYLYVIYNAKIDSAAQSPKLRIQTRLFRDGKLLLEGQPIPVPISHQKDLQRIEISDSITLGTDLETGDYVLQIIVLDDLAKEKKQLATQSIDFEIIK